MPQVTIRCPLSELDFGGRQRAEGFGFHKECERSRPLCSAFLLNHLIRSRQDVRRDRQTDLLRRFEVDDKLELYRLLYRQISRLRSLEDFIDIGGGTVEQIG